MMLQKMLDFPCILRYNEKEAKWKGASHEGTENLFCLQ